MDIFKACVVLLQNLCHVIAERQAFPVRDKTDPVADSGDPVQTHKVIGGKGVASMPGIGVSCAKVAGFIRMKGGMPEGFIILYPIHYNVFYGEVFAVTVEDFLCGNLDFRVLLDKKTIGGIGPVSDEAVNDIRCACGMFAAVSGVDIPGIPKEVLGIGNGTAVIFCNGMSA